MNSICSFGFGTICEFPMRVLWEDWFTGLVYMASSSFTVALVSVLLHLLRSTEANQYMDCKDFHPSCVTWASKVSLWYNHCHPLTVLCQGECTRNAAYMQQTCKVSCHAAGCSVAAPPPLSVVFWRPVGPNLLGQDMPTRGGCSSSPASESCDGAIDGDLQSCTLDRSCWVRY